MKKTTLKLTTLLLSCVFVVFTGCNHDDISDKEFVNEYFEKGNDDAKKSAPTTGKTYYIQNVHSGKYLDVSGYSTSNGGDIHQWELTGGSNQKWNITAVGGSYYKITSVHSGKVLDIAGHSTSDGGEIHQWQYFGNDNQKFSFSGSTSAGYKIKNKGSNKVVDVSGWSTSNGGKVHQWADNNTNNQRWRFIEVGTLIGTSDNTFELGAYSIESSSHFPTTTITTATNSDATNTSLFGTYFTKTYSDYFLKSSALKGKRTEWKEKNQSSLNNYKTMTYEAKVTNIPTDGVTIAQLHNRGLDVKRPFIRVYIENDRIHVKETINDLTSASGQWDNAFKGPSYVAGTKFKVKLTVADGKLNVKVVTTTGAMDENFIPNVTSNVYDNSYYFKAGVYTEGDNTEPVIRFYSFED